MTEPIIEAITIHEVHFNPEKRLGRNIRHDSRSWDYRAEEAPEVVDTEHATHGLPLNQGVVGKCTAEAGVGCVNTEPLWSDGKPIRTDGDSDALYLQETTDQGAPWGGPSNPSVNDTGGSGLAVCKAMVELEWVTSYAHTFSLQAMLKALVLRGGMMGSYWYDSMDRPDPNTGIVSVSPNADIRGGHEYFAYLIDVEKQLVGFWNSWGPEFGLGGKFAMTWDTIDDLLHQQGDYTVPVI